MNARELRVSNHRLVASGVTFAVTPSARIRFAAPTKLSNNSTSELSLSAYSASDAPRLWRSAQPRVVGKAEYG